MLEEYVEYVSSDTKYDFIVKPPGGTRRRDGMDLSLLSTEVSTPWIM